MKSKWWLGVALVLVTGGWIHSVSAQGMGGGMGGGMGRGAAGRSAKGRLQRLFRGIGELEKGKAPLTKAQAKTVVSAVRPWEKKPKMTEAQARDLYLKLNNTLSTKQKNELDKMTALRRRFARGSGDGGAGAGNRPGGGTGRTGGRPRMSEADRAAFMKYLRSDFARTINPFYPPSSYAEIKKMPQRFRQRQQQAWQQRHNLLAALAKKAG